MIVERGAFTTGYGLLSMVFWHLAWRLVLVVVIALVELGKKIDEH
jgi:hypothetical protein